MGFSVNLRRFVKGARARGAAWIGGFEILRQLLTPEGRSIVWTKMRAGSALHQTTTYTASDRYPYLFEQARLLRPDAARILSFGCSTGEELVSIRSRFPRAEIIGAEINGRSRRMAQTMVRADERCTVVAPERVDGNFDIIFCLAVLQREPHKVDERNLENLTSLYSFAKFDGIVRFLVDRLRPGALLCVEYAQYRIEDSTACDRMVPIPNAPLISGSMFGRDGARLASHKASTLFLKKGAASQAGPRGGGR